MNTGVNQNVEWDQQQENQSSSIINRNMNALHFIILVIMVVKVHKILNIE